MSLNLPYLNVTTINSVIIGSWTMNATTGLGGPNYTFDQIEFSTSTGNYVLTGINTNTSSSTGGTSTRTWLNTGNVTLYDTNTSINRLNLVVGQAYTIYGQGQGTSSPNMPNPVPSLLTTPIVTATGSPITVPAGMCFLKNPGP